MTADIDRSVGCAPAGDSARPGRFRWFRGGAVVLAVAGAVVTFLVGGMPVASASSDTPLTGAGLTLLDPDFALDLQRREMKVEAVGGARKVDADIQLPVAKGSKIQYGKKVTGGKVILRGGIELSKGDKKLALSNMSYDIRSGGLTARVGAKANVVIGSANDPDSAEVVMNEGTTRATLKLANQGLKLHADFFTAVDNAVGSNLSADFPDGALIAAELDVDVDLAVGDKLNTALIVALGLDNEIDLDLGVDALLDADLDLSIDLL
ncbi:hypothetical protein NDR87_18715 [Nocardia sp. CDC159]|uniref:Uncharacterized protein n=1 Tax=Nocardia pulmonis TaxID=2951408 RepID=A0A9X2IX46_9NOCA|nr:MULTISPECIES: hypothetical protein [Nocardia]MCM6775627.1 hypothetical protein [Nocardia pulmonis]MCM6788397.1 hypothetical protein [Nocardia sp. CDC159]